jgi:predicted peptidase
MQSNDSSVLSDLIAGGGSSGVGQRPGLPTPAGRGIETPRSGFFPRALCLLVSALASLWTFAATVCAQTAPASVAITLVTRPLPQTPGYHIIKFVAHFNDRDYPMASGIFLPRAWFESHTPLPLVITLHNRGTNGTSGEGLNYEGLALLMTTDHTDPRHAGEVPAHPVHLHTDAQFVGLVPQCPVGFGWETPVIARVLDRLIDRIVPAYHLDPNHVILTGFSYGASSTWAIALQLPNRFSAIAPIAGRQTSNPALDVLKLNGIPIYLAVGSNDHSIPNDTQQMHQALLDVGHTPLRFKIMPGGSHWSYGDIYLDPDFWNWLLAQRAGPYATTQPSLTTSYPVYPPAPAVDTSTPPPGHGILCQYWRDMPGNTIADLSGDPSFPSFPSEQRVLPTMETPLNQRPNFGACLRGWLCPPVTGDYTLAIASDDSGQLLLSPDDRPDHLAIIAQATHWTWPREWNQTPQQQSRPLRLQAGQRYFIEALQKDGGGDNHLSVAWKLPDGTLQGPIPAANLAPAAAVSVPGPRIALVTPPEVPRDAGLHRVQVVVEYRGRRRRSAILILMPRNLAPDTPPPAIVYCPDPAQRSLDGFPPPAGPAGALGADPLASWSPFVVLVPQTPADANWENPSTARLMALVVDRLLHDLAVDPARIYLTGSNTGGSNAWRLAARMPARFAAIAPFDALEVAAGNLVTALMGTEVHIITGVKNGVATDSANRMKAALAKLTPPPEVVYEMNMGDEVARSYYTRRDFYQWLLQWTRPPGKPAIQTTQPSVQ